MTNPFRITLWSKTLARVGIIGDPLSVTLNPRHNLQTTGLITVRADHHLAPKILTEGCRYTVDYHGLQVTSGIIDILGGDGAPDGALSLTLRDDWSFFADTLGWPVPTSAIGTQSAQAYDAATGPAESVLKYFAGRAITRLGLPITVAPDLGRGAIITVQMRMTSLADNLFPLVDQAGIGASIRQSPTGLVLDCYTPAWYPRTLTSHSGVVTAWEWAKTAPKYTRGVGGGAGDGTARVFRARIDTTAEALWGIKRELFTDASDATTPALLDARIDADLAAGATAAGLKLTLAETLTFRYGDTLRVGDLVTTQLIPNSTAITDVLREAVISWTKEDGAVATPVVGDRSDDTDRAFARAIARLARAVRTDRARR